MMDVRNDCNVHIFERLKVTLRYLPSTDKLASIAIASEEVDGKNVPNIERVPSSAGLSDINISETDVTTDDERDALWGPPKNFKLDNQAPSLGLSLVDYSEISHRGFDLPRGTYVKAVDDHSPAAEAGLKFGDRIIKVSFSIFFCISKKKPTIII